VLRIGDRNDFKRIRALRRIIAGQAVGGDGKAGVFICKPDDVIDGVEAASS